MREYFKLNGFKMILSQGLLFFLALSFVVVFICALYPYDPLRIDSFTVDRTEACGGGKICYNLKGEKAYDLPAFITISLVNGESIPLVSYVAHNKKGKLDAGRCILLPAFLEHSRYKIQWMAVYFSPLLGTATEIVESEWINIVDNPLLRGPRGDTGSPGPRGYTGGIVIFGGKK
jgi:hypothetical protein